MRKIYSITQDLNYEKNRVLNEVKGSTTKKQMRDNTAFDISVRKACDDDPIVKGFEIELREAQAEIDEYLMLKKLDEDIYGA